MIIYEVLAKADPDAPLVKIGSLKVTETFTPSYWGDRYLFFQHNYIKDDYALHPDWKLPDKEYNDILKKVRDKVHEF